jgi:hypothetical protein
LAPTRFEDIERVEKARRMRSKMTARKIRQELLTLELDSRGCLRSHNGVSFRVGGEGFVSKTLATAMGGSPSRVSLNIAPGANSLESMRSTAFTEWLCKACLNLVSSVLDAVDDGEPPNMTWRREDVELPSGEMSAVRRSSTTNNAGGGAAATARTAQLSKKPKKESFLRRSLSASASASSSSKTNKGKNKVTINSKDANSPVRIRAIEAFMNTYDDVTEGETRLVVLCQVCDVSRKGLLPLHRWVEVLKASIGCTLTASEAEELAEGTQSLVRGDSHQDKHVHYVKFVRTLIPSMTPARNVRLTVIPLFEATATVQKVDGVFLRFDSCEV